MNKKAKVAIFTNAGKITRNENNTYYTYLMDN